MIIDFNYRTGGGTGATDVSVTQILTAGTNIAKITVEGQETAIYAPSGTVTTGDVQTIVTNSLIPYWTSAQTNSAITSATTGFITSGDLKTVASQTVAGTGNIPAVTSTTITTVWCGTAEEYANLPSYSNNTFYIVK